MYHVTERFKRAIASSYRFNTTVEYCLPGIVPWSPVNWTDGSITSDRTAQCRWSGNMTIKDDIVGYNLLNAYGARIRIARNIYIPRVGFESVPWGVYRIEEVDDSKLSSSAQLNLVSMEQQIIDSRFPLAVTIAEGTPKTIISKLVWGAVPDAVIHYAPDLLAYNTIPAFNAQNDRWGAIEGSQDGYSIAQALGAEAYFDGRGTFRVEVVPSIKDPVAWVLNAPGSPNKNVLLNETKNMTRQGVYNVVVVKDSSTDSKAPFKPAWAWDNDASSPTYAGSSPIGGYAGNSDDSSPFGVVPRFYASPLFTSRDQMFNTAKKQIIKSIGTRFSLQFEAMANPALEPGDVVEVEDQRYLVDSWTADLKGHSMSCQTRFSKEDLGDIDIQAPTAEDVSNLYDETASSIKKEGVKNIPGMGRATYKKSSTTLRWND
jgi:hypothetical protein